MSVQPPSGLPPALSIVPFHCHDARTDQRIYVQLNFMNLMNYVHHCNSSNKFDLSRPVDTLLK
jgi:hypothetical protein